MKTIIIFQSYKQASAIFNVWITVKQIVRPWGVTNNMNKKKIAYQKQIWAETPY